MIVCGGRDYDDRDTLFALMDTYRANLGITHVVTGAQRQWCSKRRRFIGADHLAEEWARARALWYSGLPADWNTFGNSAGPRRNRRMNAEAKPRYVIAFAGGRGTADMVSVARSAGIDVIWALTDPATSE